jgi:hypothetical protein
MWGLFSKKKKTPTVIERLEETMNKTMSPTESASARFPFQGSEPEIQDLTSSGTFSEGGAAVADKKFMNLMEVLNNPEKQGDLLDTMNNFFSSNFNAISDLIQARKTQQTLSKSISAESFIPYNQKIGRINSMIKKTQEDDKRDKEQYENAFQRSRVV